MFEKPEVSVEDLIKVQNKYSELNTDLLEALDLLTTAGPNPMLIDSKEYWERFNKLTDKYFEQEDCEDDCGDCNEEW